MTTTTPPATTDIRDTIIGILIEAGATMNNDRHGIGLYADRILGIFYPPTCPHVRASNEDNGYITCEDCGDWLGVWKIR